MTDDADEPAYAKWPEFEWDAFLTSAAPKTRARISGLIAGRFGDGSWNPKTPELTLVCDSDVCGGGNRLFFTSSGRHLTGGIFTPLVLEYTCRNCGDGVKVYAVLVFSDGSKPALAIKMGEWPPFGSKIPSRAITLVRTDRDLLFKAVQAEDAGLGIGAFAYYRRVVENQRDRLLEGILKVAKAQGGEADVVKTIEAARKEKQFEKSVRMVKDAVPTSLLIKGHSPLTLLHDAYSESLHQHTDEECLEIARTMRLVLFELADRIAEALRDEAKLNEAVSKLLNRQKERGTEAKG